MKKIICAAVVLFILIPFVILPANASTQVNPEWILDFSAARKDEIFNQSCMSMAITGKFEFNDYYMTVTPPDSYKWLLGFWCEINAAETQYVKLRIKNNSAGDTFSMWFSPNDAAGGSPTAG